MNKNDITAERKDQIIEGLLDEYMCGITIDGLEVLKCVMTEEELAAYGYDVDSIEAES